MALHMLRKRYASERVTGAMTRIRQGLFGQGAPTYAIAEMGPAIGGREGIYHYHEGDVFLPGAPSWVFEPSTELPLKSIWGGGSGVNQGFLILGDGNSYFNPIQPPQVYSQQTVRTSGVGGLQAGQIAFQPLLTEDPGMGA